MNRQDAKKKGKKPVQKQLKERGLISPNQSIADPMGMYTGVPLDRREQPVQDADDL